MQSCARKWQEHPQDFHVYLRDRRLTGSEYKPRVLYILLLTVSLHDVADLLRNMPVLIKCYHSVALFTYILMAIAQNSAKFKIDLELTGGLRETDISESNQLNQTVSSSSNIV